MAGIGIGRALGLSAALVASTLVVSLASPAEARITRIEITSVQSPSFEGTSFGTTGQYEKLVGRVYGEIDPKDPLNAVITDIELTPANARGMVGWNLRKNPAEDGCDYSGMVIPFAKTRAERLAKGDPRLSLEERYADHQAYVGAVTKAAADSVSHGFLLKEDADRYVAAAEASDIRK